jgi:hypothetical protein
MARSAKAVKDDATKVAKNEKTKKARDRDVEFSGKIFEDLTGPEEKLLLKRIAIAMGYIVDSPD